MSTTYPFEQLMTGAGWFLYDKCRCGGILTYKFRKKGDNTKQINVFPERKLYSILKGERKSFTGILNNLYTAL